MEHDLEAYRKQCAGICAAVPKNPTNLKLVFDLETTGLNNYRLQRQALRYSVSRVLRYSIPTGCHGFRPHA